MLEFLAFFFFGGYLFSVKGPNPISVTGQKRVLRKWTKEKERKTKKKQKTKLLLVGYNEKGKCIIFLLKFVIACMEEFSVCFLLMFLVLLEY